MKSRESKESRGNDAVTRGGMLLRAILESEWEYILSLIPEQVRKEKQISADLWEYQWKGDYAEDARYVYPAQWSLVNAAIHVLIENSDATERIIEQGEADAGERERILRQYAEVMKPGHSPGFWVLLPLLEAMKKYIQAKPAQPPADGENKCPMCSNGTLESSCDSCQYIGPLQ